MADRRRQLNAFLLLIFVAFSVGGVAAQNQAGASPGPAHPACDMAYAIAATTPGVMIKRSTGVFQDEALRHPVRGCHLAISGSFARAPANGDAATRLRDGFAARGWQEMLAYSADGMDGTTFAFRKADVACISRGTWNGGADGEPPIPREDAYRVSVLCTSPAPPQERGQ